MRKKKEVDQVDPSTSDGQLNIIADADKEAPEPEPAKKPRKPRTPRAPSETKTTTRTSAKQQREADQKATEELLGMATRQLCWMSVKLTGRVVPSAALQTAMGAPVPMDLVKDLDSLMGLVASDGARVLEKYGMLASPEVSLGISVALLAAAIWSLPTQADVDRTYARMKADAAQAAQAAPST